MTDEAVRRQPGLAELDDTTLAVRTLISASQDLTVRMARRMGVNVSDMTAILWLSEHGPVGGAELARRLGISTAATTVLLDRLELAGYVERVRDTADRRRVRVTVTAEARAAALHAWRPVILDIDEVCRSLPPAQQPLVRDLQRLDRRGRRGQHLAAHGHLHAGRTGRAWANTLRTSAGSRGGSRCSTTSISTTASWPASRSSR